MPGHSTGGAQGEPTYQALIEQIRGSPSVTPDETGWKVGGQLWWMWAFSTAQVTVYAIQLGRGFEQAARVLGADESRVITPIFHIRTLKDATVMSRFVSWSNKR